MGEKKKEGGEKKKDDDLVTVVLKVDMHCEGCVLKIKRSVKGFNGVAAVSADLASNKLTVVGKVEPMKLRERVEEKTHKKVDLISPAPPKPKDDDNKKPAGEGDPKDQKQKAPKVSTVVLKIRLHCEGCSQRIVKTIRKINGVESVAIDAGKDLVAIKGTMDATSLPDVLKNKLKRTVEIVPPKKDEGSGEKNKEGGGDKEKDSPSVITNKMDHPAFYYGGYYVAPQMFSDENPNACSVM